MKRRIARMLALGIVLSLLLTLAAPLPAQAYPNVTGRIYQARGSGSRTMPYYLRLRRAGTKYWVDKRTKARWNDSGWRSLAPLMREEEVIDHVIIGQRARITWRKLRSGKRLIVRIRIYGGLYFG